jgi:DNA-binding beta-propeller fold protein YncE
MRQGSKLRIFRLAAAFMLGAVVVTIGLTGFGEFFSPVGTGSTVGNGTSTYVYVTNSGGTLAEYSLTSGVLAALSGSPVALTETPTSIVVAPNNQFVYVGSSSGAFVYTINSDGTLTEGNSNNIAYINANGYIPASMVIDPTSSWLIIAYQSETELDAVQISPTTGLPTGAVFSVTTTFADPTPQLAISAANTQVFVALGTGGTQAFGFTPTGTTAPSGPWGSSVSIGFLAKDGGTADTAVAVDPTSKYLYIAEQNSNAAGAIAGTLRLISTASLGTDLDDEPVGVGPSAVLSDLTGAYAYVTNATDGTISGFSLGATTQKLTSLGTAFPTEASPVGLVEDSSKTYLMDVGNGANPNLWLYSFDSTSAGSLDVGTTKSTASTNPSLANGIAATH